MDLIKEAFQKIKEDIQSLQYQLSELRQELDFLKENFSEILRNQTNNRSEKESNQQTDTQTDIQHIKTDLSLLKENFQQTIRQIKSTNQQQQTQINTNTTHIPTGDMPQYILKSQNSDISTGNRGVSTDSQTVKQTDNSTGNEGVKFVLTSKEHLTRTSKLPLEKVTELINSLDQIKKELRNKLKKLTNQEMSVFSAIYELENKGFIVDYTLLSNVLNITESSIRDYIQRLVKKGVPIEKHKENNKKVLVNISKDLKQVASLQTILQLREL